ncbi:MAG: flagellar hook-associated protein FlgK [Candidatus Pristimantibacillus lignocellulolyticus]|uniref:Flagellar hook-associated protein 1 n=1 Tax=Candidatus Pristimantibacillus lignocellulolyticus TaxID=2994561 RepID=A0A9J6ZIQ0_9BACL|nr:MAG: flagellar hook-associated protein FlgK [Candidatus Pristimantibacillus lignocellulolyticus]
MVSSFHGLETSKRAILTQSVALSTIGHNIANASTEGYSRQRVNLINASPLSAPGFNRIFTPGQIGSGVEYTSITRVRDSYLDMQYRRENQEKGLNSIYKATMDSIQTIINEPSDNGVSAVMDKFWNSLEVMNRDPNLLSARVDFIGNAKNMADTFNKIGTSLTTLEGDIDSNIDIKLNEANNLIDGISQLNETIRKIEMLGDHANDYRDQRDVLVDKLSKIVDVQYTEDPSGMVNVYSGGVQVVNGQVPTALTRADVANITSGEIAGYKKSQADIIQTRSQLDALVDTLINGKVQITMPNGYKTSTDMVADNDVTAVNALGVTTNYAAGTTIPAGSKITTSAKFTVDGFNGVHKMGYTLNSPAETGLDFFTLKDPTLPFSIDNIEVNPEIQKDTNKVAASGQYEMNGTDMVTIKGNSDIALALTSLRNLKFEFPANMTSLSTGTTDDYFRAFVSDLGTRANIAETNLSKSSDLTDNVEIRRQSVSGVQLDEEMTDMLRFQHAYNAAARNMTAVDEMLDRIINGMGLVGR